LGANKYGLEGVANLKQIPASDANLIIGHPKIKNASGGPVRLLATWD
jgi:kynurenine formamidase